MRYDLKELSIETHFSGRKYHALQINQVVPQPDHGHFLLLFFNYFNKPG